jgi:hypothetical protein
MTFASAAQQRGIAPVAPNATLRKTATQRGLNRLRSYRRNHATWQQSWSFAHTKLQLCRKSLSMRLAGRAMAAPR